MANIDELIPEVHVETPKCHTGIIKKNLQATLRHFCKETYYWQHEIPDITLLPFNEQAPETYLYTLELPDHTEIIAIKELIYQNRPLLMKSTHWLNDEMPDWRTQTGDPQCYIQLSDRRVRFVPASDEVKPIAIAGHVILQPTRHAEEFSDDILQYDQCLINGALARLLSMGKKPWTNQRRAQVCQLEYVEGVSQAKHMAMRDFSTGYETMARRSWL